ncbi:nitrogen assimilation transcription factor nit-4 [Diaporthe helianthi]|uniref:Nitrogen assimilation transcription factor nit-4 n=1 Tax=Diaporthe helianthi TaxID=158607 RepID=A0A2P5HWT2_DIAHE|nr:nitrogen assimilation transcription factor nit-4 [Diaporthe helianthi]
MAKRGNGSQSRVSHVGISACAPPSKKYVESLQARIRHLEAQVVSLGSKPAYESSKLDLNAEVDEQDESSGDDEKDPLSDLTVLAGRLNVIDDGQLHYFGSQSSYNLVREPLREADPHEPSHKAQVEGLLATAQLGKTVSISDELQDHLLDLYWRWQNPWNYVIHKGAFLKSFKGEDDGKYCSPLLLCSMFAIAARYSDRPELRSVQDDPNTTGDAFCEQAKILMLYEAEAPTITTVQAACILALRIMSDGKEALGWLYAGNATRMAHNLGLHLDSSKWIAAGSVSEQEVEAREVTWWGCYVVDNYAANNKLSNRELEDVISKADVELRTHFAALPSFLRISHSPKVPMLPHVCLFHIQYHAHLILLHRPLIRNRGRKNSASLDTSTNDGRNNKRDEYENQHMAACRHSATEIARLLRTYKQQYTLRRIPIAAVHLCFSAVVIHLMDSRPSNPNRSQAIRHLQTCVDALRDLRTAWCAWSDRALRAVGLLAREWYQCEDISLIQSCDDTLNLRGLETSHAGGVEAEAGDHWQSDSLAFLFDVGTPGQSMDSLVTDWLWESGYDVSNAIGE